MSGLVRSPELQVVIWFAVGAAVASLIRDPWTRAPLARCVEGAAIAIFLGTLFCLGVGQGEEGVTRLPRGLGVAAPTLVAGLGVVVYIAVLRLIARLSLRRD